MSDFRPADAQADAQQERTWIEGLRAGRADVYRELFDTYTPSLWRFARLSVPAAVAEEIVQDVMFDVWQRRETLEVRDGFAPYLFGAVRNRVWQYLRRERVAQRAEVVHDDAPLAMGAAAPAPDAAAAASDLRAAALDALRELSELQRAVVVLRWTHEMRYEQIAAALSITPEAARQHVSRTQRVIRPLLERFRHPR